MPPPTLRRYGKPPGHETARALLLSAGHLSLPKKLILAQSNPTSSNVEIIPLPDDGVFPNSMIRPALVLRGAFSFAEGDEEARDPADVIQATFEKNGWTNGWRDGVYDFDHYHSTAHEVLGCYSGEAELQLGGPRGSVHVLQKGDVLVVPAGVAHRRIQASEDFRVVGCYAEGRQCDMNRGKSSERPRVDDNIAALPRPNADPVYGASGPLIHNWK